jgi:hypothetical protein
MECFLLDRKAFKRFTERLDEQPVENSGLRRLLRMIVYGNGERTGGQVGSVLTRTLPWRCRSDRLTRTSCGTGRVGPGAAKSTEAARIYPRPLRGCAGPDESEPERGEPDFLVADTFVDVVDHHRQLALAWQCLPVRLRVQLPPRRNH